MRRSLVTQKTIFRMHISNLLGFNLTMNTGSIAALFYLLIVCIMLHFGVLQNMETAVTMFRYLWQASLLAPCLSLCCQF